MQHNYGTKHITEAAKYNTIIELKSNTTVEAKYNTTVEAKTTQ